MDFDKFLGTLNESNGNNGFRRVSAQQLAESAGESVDGIKAQGRYYVPQKEYGGFRHIVSEKGPNSWAVYYLDQVGTGAATVDDEADWGEFEMARNEARDLERLRNYLKEGNGEDNGINLDGFAVRRKVEGDFATVLKECVNIVKG